MYDFTSLYANGLKLYVKRVIIHYEGSGEIIIKTSDGIYNKELEYDSGHLSASVDGYNAVRRKPHVETAIFEVPNDDSHIICIGKNTSGLMIRQVHAIIGSKSIPVGIKLESFSGTGVTGDPEDPLLPEDGETEIYTYDFGDV